MKKIRLIRVEGKPGEMNERFYRLIRRALRMAWEEESQQVKQKEEA